MWGGRSPPGGAQRRPGSVMNGGPERRVRQSRFGIEIHFPIRFYSVDKNGTTRLK